MENFFRHHWAIPAVLNLLVLFQTVRYTDVKQNMTNFQLLQSFPLLPRPLPHLERLALVPQGTFGPLIFLPT